MPRFRKKPVEITAEQWRPGVDVPGVQWEPPEDAPSRIPGETAFVLPARPYVVTAHGQKAYLADGDWVIAEPDGRGYYPCKPDIFAATYDPVS